MFEGFDMDFIELSDATLRVRHGGVGEPLLLLHGHPRTHTTWHRVAPLLATKFRVVCPDLRGFGQSSHPPGLPDHAGSSKRAKARDCLELMGRLGFNRFHVAGHDRGSYTAFRLAMDHPQAVRRLAVLDGVPILEALERCTEKFARLWWHWFFFCQPEKPERAIMADPIAWYGADPKAMHGPRHARRLSRRPGGGSPA
jgi:haloacetate dehalogenase